MDKLTRYRETIRRLMAEYAAWKPPTPAITSEQIQDTAQDHYLLKYVGWDGRRRVNATAFHLDIIGGKVWVQYDGSNRSVTDALVEAGIPKEDIVPAEQPPEVRAELGFGIG
jgi:XisI protein